MPSLLCCPMCRPRYQRLVRGVISRNVSDGLNPVVMEKLYYYSLLYPEKMDQVGEYMHERAAKHLRKGRYRHAALSMSALAQLMSSADAHVREQIVDSFLNTVLMCLGSPSPHLQITATYCFIRFVILKDETLYPWNYEQLLIEFADMCHNTIENIDVQEEVRHAGIEGLEAILFWCDGLIDNIYSFTYMNVILPCLLYNMNDPEYLSMSMAEREVYSMNSAAIAESCMKEILIRSYASRLHYVLDPILNYLDECDLWWDNLFTSEVFKLVMTSVEATFAYNVIESLVNHASYEFTEDATTRARILETVIQISRGVTEESMGPTAFYCVGILVENLENSVKRTTLEESEESKDDEILYQDAVVRTLQIISSKLPHYYKLEIMVFLVNHTPFPSRGIMDARLRYIILDLLGEVSREYCTSHFTSTLPMNLLRPLLRISLSPNPKVRLSVHTILHNLTDRHGNLGKLKEPTADISSMDLHVETCTPLDVAFMRRNGPEIFHALYEGFECFNNNAQNINAVYTSSALFVIEASSESILVETLRFLINIQDLTLKRAHTWLWNTDLARVVESLLSILLCTVPAAKFLKDKAGFWAAPPAVREWMAARTLLHRPRVVDCLRRDGWVGVTEHHLSSYEATRDSVWPQRVATVMHVSVTHAWGRTCSRAHTGASRVSVVTSASSVREERSPRLLPPVPPHGTEEENRWLFLTDVLMLNEEEGDSDAESDDFSDNEDGVGERRDHGGGDTDVTRLETFAEEEGDEDDRSTTSEEETTSSSSISVAVPVLPPILVSSSSSLVVPQSEPNVSDPVTTVTALPGEGSAALSAVERSPSDEPVPSSIAHPVTAVSALTGLPTAVPEIIAPCGKISCARAIGPIAPCGRGPCTRFLATRNLPPSVPPISEAVDTRLHSAEPAIVPPLLTISPISSARSIRTTSSSSDTTTPPAQGRTATSSTSTTERDIPPKVAGDNIASETVFSAAPLATSSLIDHHPPRSSKDSAATFSEVVFRPPGAGEAAFDVTGNGVATADTRAAAPTHHISTRSPAREIYTSHLGRTSWLAKTSGAAVIARLKADAAITAAHRRLKFTEKQARLRMHYRTKPFEQLRPQHGRRAVLEESGLRATLAVALRDVPPPSSSPPSPVGLPPVRASLLHFVEDDIFGIFDD